jgi:hypothetical protein
MATSGTKTFSIDTGELIEEAYELAGLELRTSYDAQTARRSLNIMFADWANRGINLWTVAQVTLDLVESTASYTLNAYDIDVLDAVIRRDSTDISIDRISRSEYLGIPTKTTEGRPSQFYVERLDTPKLHLWPTPENSTDKFISYRIQRIDDVTASAEDQEVPSRFIPPMVNGLAYQVAMKKNPQMAGVLKVEYEESFARAADEDRDRASIHITPRIRV